MLPAFGSNGVWLDYLVLNGRIGSAKISNRQQAKEYLEAVEVNVEEYLHSQVLTDPGAPLDEKQIPNYIERLQLARTDLEQTLLLYEYAMGYSLR